MVYLYMPPRFKSPSPYVAEPNRVRFPVEIRSVRNKPLTVQILNTPKPWLKGRQTNTRTMNTKCNLQVCKWYRRRRALKRLQQIHQIEKSIPLDPKEYLAKVELEKNLIEKVRQEKLEKLRAKSPPAVAYTYNEKLPKKYRKKEVAFYDDKKPRRSRKKEEFNYYTYDDKQAKKQEKKERKAQKRYEKELRRIDKENAKRLKNDRLAEERYAKKLAKAEAKQAQKLRKRNVDNIIEETTRVKKQKKYKDKPTKTYSVSPAKTVYTKREIVYQEPLANRFTNCFYRFCCQLYCYFTFFLILGFVIVVLI